MSKMTSFERRGWGGLGVVSTLVALSAMVGVDCTDANPPPASSDDAASPSEDSALPPTGDTGADSQPTPDAGSDATVDGGNLPFDSGPLLDSGSDAANDVGAPDAGPCTGTVLDSGACFVVLATGQDKPTGIAVVGSYVYWTNQGSSANSGSVNRVPISGIQYTVLAHNQDFTSGIAVDSNNAYWANEGDGIGLGSIMSVSLTDGGAPTVLASGQTGPYFVALDPDNVYFTTYGGGSVTDHIAMVAKTGSPDGGATELTASNGPWGIVTDSNDVYWTDANFTYSLPLGAPGTPTEVTNAGTQGIALGGSNLFACTGTGLVIAPKIDPTKANTPVGTASQYLCWAVATDALNVYWSDDFENIWSMPQNGSTPQALYNSTLDRPMGIAVDALNVYWVTNTGKVLQISK